jgi:glycogen phosphorylase
MNKQDTMHDARALLKKLHALSRNIWWAWNTEAQALFKELSPQQWELTHHNPVAVLAEISEGEVLARLGDSEYAGRVEEIHDRFVSYVEEKDTWASVHSKELKAPVAYFSAEFGFHESLRTYSGGLGILAGDHTKSASDLGVPFVGITLVYRQGYFEQRLALDGWQQEQYTNADPAKLPVEIVLDKKGDPVRCSVQIGFSTVYIHAWKLAVGRSALYLLDTNLKENEERFRDITAHVYGGDSTTRIAQEIVLGIGGVRLLREIGIEPSVYHMNEGHSAFLTLELLDEQIKRHKNLEKAEEGVRKKCIFTTHTPVAAGHDRFSKDLVAYAFEGMVKDFNFPMEELVNYGRVTPNNELELFCMTVLALKMSRSANGVSKLHGEVSREMWKGLYPQLTVDKVPIGSITNGVHIGGWATEKADHFWKKHLGAGWQDHFLKPSFWEKVADPSFVSDEELWALRYSLRRELIEFSRQQLRTQHSRMGNGMGVFDTILNPDALTIGFSRRFATYKRAPLLFTNFERSLELFNDPQRPLQIIFAGKAHPRDDEGKKFIKRIVELSNHPMLFGKVVFIENYDINVARHLIAGADVWLNNPRRPLEASGTSGQKVVIHGGLNCGIMDGWWREAYDGKNGWAIGGDESPASPEVQDAQDYERLFDVMKNQILPEFYHRNEKGIPVRWLERVRHAIVTLVPQYNTHRMVADYVKEYYIE